MRVLCDLARWATPESIVLKEGGCRCTAYLVREMLGSQRNADTGTSTVTVHSASITDCLHISTCFVWADV